MVLSARTARTAVARRLTNNYDAFEVIGTTLILENWAENANLFRESGPDNSKRMVR